jgi:hypothetical protein
VNTRRALRSGLIGAIAFIFALIYVPQCKVPIYAENTGLLSLALAATVTFCIYRFA